MKNEIGRFGKTGVALTMLFAVCSHPSWSAPANPTVPISFSSTGGGPGSPSLLQLGLSQPIEFTLIGSGAINDFLLFVVKNAQTNPLQYQDYLNTPSVNTISYSINGGASYLTTGWIDGGFNSQDVGPADSYLYAQLPISVAPGDKITFSSGVFEGYSMNNTFSIPTTGTYTTFLANSGLGSGGERISGFGSVVPEPSAFSLLIMGLGGVMVCRRFARKV